MIEKIPVSKILVRNGKEEFLVVKERESGQWELPGGKIDEDENRFEAATRELEEETGIYIEDFKDVVRIEIEDEDCVNCWILFAEVEDIEIELYKDELSDYKWVTPEEFLRMDWHTDAGYNIVPMKNLGNYLKKEHIY